MQPYASAPSHHEFLGPQFLVQGNPLVMILKEKKFSIGSDSTVTTQSGEVLFKFDAKALSLKDKRVLYDRNGTVVATMNQKVSPFPPQYIFLHKSPAVEMVVK